MRYIIKFTKPTELVNSNTQELVNSFIHKLLGNNNSYHDSKSNYTISNLKGGKLDKETNTLTFKKNPYIVISSNDIVFINKIITGLFQTKTLGYGMNVENLLPIMESYNNGWDRFNTLDPIHIKECIDGTKIRKHITINDNDFKEKLTKHIINKFTKINPDLDFSDFKLEIGKGKVKKVYVGDVWNFASSVQLSIYSNKEVKEHLYNYGIGQSTGSGFGTIYQLKNHNVYEF